MIPVQVVIRLPRRRPQLWRRSIINLGVLGVLLCLRNNLHHLLKLLNDLEAKTCQTDNSGYNNCEDRPRSTGSVITPAEEAFSKLELFLSVFPGDDDDPVKGFTELQYTFIRSLQFFWPLDKFQGVTVVLDDTVCDNTPEDQAAMTSKVQSFFRDDFAAKTKVRYNPRTNSKLYGTGWYIQQLIRFWADNFTDAEYIGFVDDDTLFTRAVHSTELFDELGRPHAIAKHIRGQLESWANSSYYAFQRPILVDGGPCFPVIVKRDHLKDVRRAILEAHPEFSYFDEYFQEAVKSGVGSRIGTISEFCIMMDYCFFHAKDSYCWHFETRPDQWGLQENGGNRREIHSGTTASLGVTKEMLFPFPRVSIHANYLGWIKNHNERIRYRTKIGRSNLVDTIIRDGYCYSLPLLAGDEKSNNRSRTGIEAYCRDTTYDDIYAQGEWDFGGNNHWIETDRGGVIQAHTKSMKRNVVFEWNIEELNAMQLPE